MHEYLSRHPEIFMPQSKVEPHFFATDLNYCRAYAPFRDPAAYYALFRGATNEKRIGEASVFYLYSKNAATEIKRTCPDARIIIMLRNPVEMLYSLHGKLLFLADEFLQDFETALDSEQDRKNGRKLPRNMDGAREALYYREVARYTAQVKRYLETFGESNVHVIIFEDLKSNTPLTYRQVLEFLGVDPDFQPHFEVVNEHMGLRSSRLKDFANHLPPILVRLARAGVSEPSRIRLRNWIERLNTRQARRPALEPRQRRRLQADFLEDIDSLAQLIGRDLTSWTLTEEGDGSGEA